MYFDETALNDHVLDALYDMHFDVCTPIQEQCIPPILEGRDLLGVAQTGTGKTAAYLLPILSLLDDGGYPSDSINCVIMSPTRELAQQIDQAMQGFGYYLGVSSVAVYGGNDGNRYDQELKSFGMGADVVIATPGRLISHISLGSADLSKVSFFVLDEADRMLDMGFADDIKMIASKLPPTCQTIMFSATMPEKIEELAKTLLKNPVEVKIAVSRPADKIRQSAYVCYETQKIGIIKEIFRQGDLNRVIIFSGKKQKVKAINRTMMQMHINSGEMHSDLSQAERDEMLYKFKSGQIDVLVATDIVARGIDIDDIAMVINYDVPHDPEDYVHRIGRTARADRDGVATTFVSDTEIGLFKQIERFLGHEVEKKDMPEKLGETPEYKSVNGRKNKSKGRGAADGGDKRSNAKDKTHSKDNAKPNRRNRRKGAEGEKAATPSADNNPTTDKTAENGGTTPLDDTKVKDNVTADNNKRPHNHDNGKSQNATDDATGSDDADNNTNADNGNERKPAKKRRRPSRRKGDNDANSADNDANSADNAPDAANNGQSERPNNRRKAPRENRPDSENGNGKNTDRSLNTGNATADNADGTPKRPKRRRKPRQKPSGDRNYDKEEKMLPAPKQSSALTQILKKPLAWLKSFGKKKD